MKTKKLLAVGMAAAMAMAMAVPVMAETSPVTIEAATGSTGFDVSTSISKANAVDSALQDFYVTISWTTTSGSYTIGSNTYNWDASEKKYVRADQGTGVTSSGNSAAVATITITNQSNADMDYIIAYSNYAGTTETATAETTAVGSKTGTLESFITKNNIDVTADNSGAAELDYSGSGYVADSAEYVGNIALTNYKADSYPSGAVKFGSYTVSISNQSTPK